MSVARTLVIVKTVVFGRAGGPTVTVTSGQNVSCMRSYQQFLSCTETYAGIEPDVRARLHFATGICD